MSDTIGLWDHFKSLGDFKGREDRASFWLYAAFVLAILIVAASALLTAMAARSMQGIPGSMPPAGFTAVYLCVTLGLAVVLYAAAVVRRLHDGGRSGAWGLIPWPFILYSSIQMSRVSDAITQGEHPDMAAFLSISISNIVCFVALVALLVLLTGPSRPEPNG